MMDHILVPIDESDPSSDALQFVLEEYPESTITVLHVVDPADSIVGSSIEGASTGEAVLERLEEHGEQLLEEAREEAEAHGVTIETAQVTGAVGRSIVQYAEEHDVDHVVIGSHGRTGASRVLLGSVAESVTRRSPVPVTIIR